MAGRAVLALTKQGNGAREELGAAEWAGVER